MLAALLFAQAAAAVTVDVQQGRHLAGTALVLRLNADEIISQARLSGFHQEAAFYLADAPAERHRKYYAIVAIPLEERSGRYPLTVRWAGAQGPEEQSVSVAVQGRSRKARHLALPQKAEQAMKSLDTEKPMLDQVLKQEEASEPQWRGNFMLPVSGPLREGFGVARRYGSTQALWRHKGLDLGVPEGTSVCAANFGTVVFAHEHMAAYGGLLVIHHGYGLCSTYMHLRQILVAPGALVNKGQVVALSGSEGIATGPHLHWQLNLHGFPIDPMPWIDRPAAESVK